MVNPLLSLPGGYSFQDIWDGGGAYLMKGGIVTSFHHKELAPKVKNLRDMKLEVMISRGLKSNGNFNLVNKPYRIISPHEVLQS